MKNKQGGKRAGAGRPPVDSLVKKVPTGYKLPQWLVDWMREQDKPAAVLIEQALSPPWMAFTNL